MLEELSAEERLFVEQLEAQCRFDLVTGCRMWEGTVDEWGLPELQHFREQEMRPLNIFAAVELNMELHLNWVFVSVGEACCRKELCVNPQHVRWYRLVADPPVCDRSKVKRAAKIEVPAPTPVIYFVQAIDGGAIKIGHTRRGIDRRLHDLQTGSPQKLNCLATLLGHAADERTLHEQFAQHRLHGEWFAPTEELLEFISTLQSR